MSTRAAAHANIALPRRFTDLLAPLLVTPDFHRFHHSRLRSEADTNYGQLFSFWDRLFDTMLVGNASAVAFGVEGFHEPSSQSLARLLVQPLLRKLDPVSS